jgi:hypothetical protein
MQAIVYHNYGSPDVLQYKEIEQPAPENLISSALSNHPFSMSAWAILHESAPSTVTVY